MASIDDFVSSMSESEGFMRPAHFQMRFNLNESISGKFSRGEEAININCHSAQIPSETFGMASDQKLAGRNRRFPISRAYSGEMSVSFYVSADGFERKLFDEWQNQIIPHRRHTVKYQDEYTQEVELITFKKDETPGLRMKFERAYPVAIREIDLDYSSSSEVSEMEVTFYFERAIEQEQQEATDITANPIEIATEELYSSITNTGFRNFS